MSTDWRADDSGNYSRLVNPQGTIAVAVATGDAATGDARYPRPRLAHKKGEMTFTAVQRNDEQLTLWSGAGAASPVNGPMTWLLLLNERNGAVFGELSLPRRAAEGNVSVWEERIVLPPRPLGAATEVIAPEPAPIDEIRIDRR